MVITTTTGAWDGAPQHVRERFVELRSRAMTGDEIQIFAMKGVEYTGGDEPTAVAPDLGEAIRVLHEELITVRDLHDVLYHAWMRANRSGAVTLSTDHLA